ncbi:DUF397 domain-containing protein [Kitasatospora sp. NPDC059327]|uniref:DUF397 domain-containing protein n=1 Tax=Kitasatospora sp. NPDC059327 TaxID=3346803 RepID=UPI0036B35871
MNNWQKASLSGEADESLEVRIVDDMVEIRDPDTGDIIVRTTPKKWEAFLLGVKAGEFDHFVA